MLKSSNTIPSVASDAVSEIPRDIKKHVEFRFRFPVEQVGQNQIVMHVPIEAGRPLVRLALPESIELSAREHDAALDAAFDAVIREIAIIR